MAVLGLRAPTSSPRRNAVNGRTAVGPAGCRSARVPSDRARKVRHAIQSSQAAPTTLTAVNSSALAAITAEMPTTAPTTCTR
jgi:hypothetical protein